MQGALDFERGPLASAADPVEGAALPLPLVVADQRFRVGLARLIRATLQPEAAFIEAHYSNMGYWAIVIEPWALDAGAHDCLILIGTSVHPSKHSLNAPQPAASLCGGPG